MSIKYRFERFSRNNKMLSILMVVLGLLLFIWPGKTLDLAARILGVGLLLAAAVTGFSWYRERNKYGAGYTTLAVAIVFLVLGLIVLIAPHGVVTLLPKLIGAAVVVNGILNLAQAMDLRGRDGARWTSALVMAILTIICGLFLIFFAFSAMKAAVMVIGGVCVYNGLSNLLIEANYRKR